MLSAVDFYTPSRSPPLSEPTRTLVGSRNFFFGRDLRPVVTEVSKECLFSP